MRLSFGRLGGIRQDHSGFAFVVSFQISGRPCPISRRPLTPSHRLIGLVPTVQVASSARHAARASPPTEPAPNTARMVQTQSIVACSLLPYEIKRIMRRGFRSPIAAGEAVELREAFVSDLRLILVVISTERQRFVIRPLRARSVYRAVRRIAHADATAHRTTVRVSVPNAVPRARCAFAFTAQKVEIPAITHRPASRRRAFRFYANTPGDRLRRARQWSAADHRLRVPCREYVMPSRCAASSASA